MQTRDKTARDYEISPRHNAGLRAEICSVARESGAMPPISLEWVLDRIEGPASPGVVR